MAFLTMADNNISISAKQDGAMYNVALNGNSMIIKNIGNEFALTLDGLNLSVGTGEAILHGRHVTSTEVNSIAIQPSQSGYVVLRLDLTQTAGNEAYLYATPVITQEEINGNGHIYDLPLCSFESTLQSATMVDMRVIGNSTDNNKADTDLSNITNVGEEKIRLVAGNVYIDDNSEKPQTPLKNNRIWGGFYPLTTIDQVIKSDWSRLSENDLAKFYGIDTSRLLASNLSDYTATEDCFVCFSSWESYVYVDGQMVYGSFGGGDVNEIVPLKAGQTIGGLLRGSRNVMRVWGVKR